MAVIARNTRPVHGWAGWAGVLALVTAGPALAGKLGQTDYWDPDQIRRGMTGYGRTVFQGVKIETFQVTIIGLLKQVRPGRDLVLARLSGGPLAKTGVIAGMSGSPVYVQDKLLGAVAYAWRFAKEPIAGITPFSQMVEFGMRRSTTQPTTRPARGADTAWRLDAPVRIGDTTYATARTGRPGTTSAAGLVLTPLAIPLTVSGFTDEAFRQMCRQLEPRGIVPVQGGAASAQVVEGADAGIKGGAPLAIGLMTGDYQMAAVGTVTHREGKQVFGFGHPMLGSGPCELPMMTGYVHTVLPSLMISSKMASPLRAVGTINMDVGTCVAGVMGPVPAMVPVRAIVSRADQHGRATYRVNVVRHRSLLPFLASMALGNAVLAAGDLPDEITVWVKASVTFKRHGPLVIEDMYSGPSVSGGSAVYGVLGDVLGRLRYLIQNPFERVEVESIEMRARTENVRRWARIESVRLDTNVVEPGQTLVARVVMLPYKGPRRVELLPVPIPKQMEPGVYRLQVCDASTSQREHIQASPHLGSPRDITQAFQLARFRYPRNRMFGRVAFEVRGVALQGRALPDLPDSMMHILKSPKRTGVTPIKDTLVVHKTLPVVVSGSLTVPFAVTREKRVRY